MRSALGGRKPELKNRSAGNRARVFRDQLVARDDHVAVELEARVGAGKGHDVLLLHATLHQGQAVELEAGHCIHFAAREHGLAQRRIHAEPGHRFRIDADRLRVDRESLGNR